MSITPSQRRKFALGLAGILSGAGMMAARHGKFSRAHKLGLAASAILLVPTLKKNSTFFGPVLHGFETRKQEYWLTIDDGPDPENSPRILETMERHGVKGIFFGIGEKVLKHQNLARKIVEAGHRLECHTYSHPAFTFWAAGPKRAAREIAWGARAIFETTGRHSEYFRSPVGFSNPFVHSVLEDFGLRMMGWSASGNDGVRHSPEKVVRKILTQIRPGGIVLLHEHQLPGMEKDQRAKTLDSLLKNLSERGYCSVLP